MAAWELSSWTKSSPRGGYVATALTEDGPGIKLDPGFIDQCNSLWLGGKPTWNIRFRSDHILNLNAPPAPPK